MWVKIWTELKDKRNFKTDYEVYGDKTKVPSNSIVEIYVGIN
jgi:predicted transcriptional regulator YdeE